MVLENNLPTEPPLQPLRMSFALSLTSAGKRGSSISSGNVTRARTCLINVIGTWPMAWQSPMLALITSLNGLDTFWKKDHIILEYMLYIRHIQGLTAPNKL